ncbi:unnamed protein product [Rhizophagus irregularis]|uniref:Uncharacterized protein n=1 Tax=Rhizophagus irregularis TaxID=588596 RepID=A0A916EIH5_9GLOM|nr:unnamed protein product [Rhizophagus irregularis]
MPYLQRSGGEKRKKKSQEKKSISIKNASYTKCTINVQYRKTEKICTKLTFGPQNKHLKKKLHLKPERGPLGSAIRYCKTSSSQSTKNLSIYFPSENQQQYLALDLLYIP